MAIVYGSIISVGAIKGSTFLNLGTTAQANVGDVIVIGVAFLSTAIAITSVTDNVVNSTNVYNFQGAINNGTTLRIECWAVVVTTTIPAGSTIAVRWTPATSVTFAATAQNYTGVAALGKVATISGTSTTVTGSMAIQDNNNFVTLTQCWQGVATAFGTGSVGNGRAGDSTSGGSAATNIDEFLQDNTAASAGTSVTNTNVLSTSEVWAGVLLELRTVAPTIPFTTEGGMILRADIQGVPRGVDNVDQAGGGIGAALKPTSNLLPSSQLWSEPDE